MSNSSVNDFFAGGAPSAKFPTPGTTIKGVIVGLDTAQQRDINGVVRTWDDGNPRMQAVVTLQTDDRDADIPDDDGERRLFVKGQMQAAIKAAIRSAGAKVPEIGGRLAVQYTGDGKQDKPGLNPPKQFVAQYQAPVAQAATGDAAGVADLL